MTSYLHFRTPKLPSDYIEDGEPIDGHAPSGKMLSWRVLDAWARHVSTGDPCEYLIVGEIRRDDGSVILMEAINLAWIEAHTSWRLVDGELSSVCPECHKANGKHERRCSVPD